MTVRVKIWLMLLVAFSLVVGAIYYFVFRETKTLVYENTSIPYGYKDNYDDSLPAGACNIVTHGKNGVDIKTFQVTYRGGKIVNKVQTDEKIVQPTTEIKTRGGDISQPLPANNHSDCQ